MSSTRRMVCNAAALPLQRRQTSRRSRRSVGRAQQRRGAIVGIGRAAGEQGGPCTGLGQRDGGRQTGWPAADHDGVINLRCIVHTGTIDVPGGIFKPSPGLKCFHRSARRNAARADMQIRAIPDSTAEVMDQTTQPVSSRGIAASAAGRIRRACLHGAWRGHRPDRDAGGRARALGQHVRLARGGADRRCDRRPAGAEARRRAAAAELVRRSARSRRRFRHLRLRAGLCDHGERLAAAAGRAAARHRHRGVERALFRRPPHEGGRQSFSRLSGAVECGGILSVPAASAAGGLQPRRRRPDRADIRAVSRAASDPRRAAALADAVAAGGLGGAGDLRARL